MSDRLLTISELAEYLGVQKSTIYARTSAKTIPFVKIGSLVRFPESKIAEWLQSHTKEPIGKGA